MKRVVFIVSAAIFGVAMPLSASPSWQSSCTQPKWEITSPTGGAQIFSTVEIRGSACLAGDFDRYKFEYRPPGSSEWVWVFDGQQEVVDGLLGLWDTTSASNTFGDGVYNIMLTVVRRDGNYVQTPLRQVLLNNRQVQETPTPEITGTPEFFFTPGTTPPLGTPTPIIILQPTVLQIQPTPGIVVTPGILQNDDGAGSGGLLDLGGLGTACLLGALAALLSFGSVAGIVFLRRRAG